MRGGARIPAVVHGIRKIAGRWKPPYVPRLQIHHHLSDDFRLPSGACSVVVPGSTKMPYPFTESEYVVRTGSRAWAFCGTNHGRRAIIPKNKAITGNMRRVKPSIFIETLHGISQEELR